MKMVHVTIHTDKFNEELDFYCSVIGLTVISDRRPQGQNLVFVAENENDTEIEIIDDASAVNAGNDNLSIGFQTDDLDRKREELVSRGIEVSSVSKPNPHVQFFYIKDPAGVKIQFIQRI